MQTSDMQRALFDNLRAMAVLLILIGHLPGLPPALTVFLYGFHVPLLFFAFGISLSNKAPTLPLRDYARFIASTLLIPYLVFFVCSYAYWLLLGALGMGSRQSLPWHAPLLGALYANGASLYVNVVLWLLVCLITATTIFRTAKRYLPLPLTLVVLAALAAAALVIDRQVLLQLPWCLGNAMLLGIVFGLGFALSARLGELRIGPAVLLPLALVLFGLSAALSHANGRIDFLSLSAGQQPILLVLNSLAGVAAATALCRALPSGRATRWLSSHLLVILAAHPILFSLLTGASRLLLGLPEGFNENIYGALAYAAWALTALLIAQRCLPVVFDYFSDRQRWFENDAPPQHIHARPGTA